MFKFIKKFFETEKRGLQEYIKDARELFFDEYFGSELNYQRKHKRLILAPIFDQNQKNYENCSFNGWADGLGIYFGRNISRRWLHAKAYQQGLCNKNGVARTYVGGMVARKWGVVFEEDLPSEEGLNLDDFVNIDFKKFDEIASKNKIGSYYTIRNTNDLFRALDMGYAVVVGRYWQSTQLSKPWIITPSNDKNYPHGTCIIGYDTCYENEDVDIESNSWGFDWGDKGNFYCRIKDLNLIQFGSYAITPIKYTPKDIKIKSIKDQINNILKEIFNMQQKDKLYDTAKSLIGQNLAPGNEKLGCAISFSAVCNIALKDNIRFVNTSQCLDWMRKEKDKWEEIHQPEPKAVIISPTSEIPVGSHLKNGHIGILGQFYAPDHSLYIMSNDSEKGYWNTRLTFKMWNDYYSIYGKLPTYYFRRIG